MGSSINIEAGKNYLINCNKLSYAIDYIKSIVPDSANILEDIKEILDFNENDIEKDTFLLVSDFGKLNLVEFDMVMKLANKEIKGVSVIGICQVGSLEFLMLENFVHIELGIC